MTKTPKTDPYCMVLVNQYGTLVRRFRFPYDQYPSKAQALEIATSMGWMQPEDRIEIQREDQGEVPIFIP